jgi:Cu-Zn family superoxide dismutase
MPLKRFVPTLAVVGLVLSASLAYSQNPAPASSGPITKAVAVLHPTQGSRVVGTVFFTKVEDGIRVQAKVVGLAPGKHGFHIHEFGDCSSPDAKSAGGHFNPKMMDHGDRTSAKRHVGDLGNIEAGATGEADLDVVDHEISFHGATSIIGRGLIVHEKADDLMTQPTGNAGGRVACGVIGVGKGS